jgi:hypothetical protein
MYSFVENRSSRRRYGSAEEKAQAFPGKCNHLASVTSLLAFATKRINPSIIILFLILISPYLTLISPYLTLSFFTLLYLSLPGSRPLRKVISGRLGGDFDLEDMECQRFEDFILQMLEYNPHRRITPHQVG